MHGRDLAHQCSRNMANLRRRGQKDGLDAGRHCPIHARHLHLVVKISPVAQPAQQKRGAIFPCGVNGQTRERRDDNLAAGRLRDFARRGVNKLALFVQRKERLLARMNANRDDYAPAKGRGGAHHVDVAVGDGIKRSSVESDRAYHVRECNRLRRRVKRLAPAFREQSGKMAGAPAVQGSCDCDAQLS